MDWTQVRVQDRRYTREIQADSKLTRGLPHPKQKIDFYFYVFGVKFDPVNEL